MGSTFVARMAAETGSSADEICRAFLIARDVTNARKHWDRVEALTSEVPTDVAAELMIGVDRMVEQYTRWYLRNDPDLGLASTIARDRPGFAELLAHLQEVATSAWQEQFDERLGGLEEQHVPPEAARFGATVPDLVYGPDVIAAARESGRTIPEVAHAFFLVGERLYLNTVEQRVSRQPAKTRWQRMAWRSQLDDLRLLRRQIVAHVIEGAGGADIETALDEYLAARVGSLRAPDGAGGQHRRRPGRRCLGGDGDGAPDPPGRGVNRLAGETSPYLLQHAANPVDWYPWGEEALERARREDRPILLSIGYAACHWCHVMAHESFEDPETAALMNRLFVNVKVDREERPDLDAVYMNAVVQFTQGHGGWPMTMFLTPTGEPFHGGTYFPPQPRMGMPSFSQVLEAVDTAYRERPDQVERAGRAHGASTCARRRSWPRARVSRRSRS